VDGLPVAETAVRVPGGDAVARVWVVAGAAAVAVVEIENASPAPVALAAVTEGPVRLGVGRPIGAVATGGTIDEVRRVVTTGGAVLTAATARAATDGAIDASARAPAVARLVPVAHRTSVRFVVGLGPDTGAALPDPARLPGPDVAARGWRAVLDRAARVEVPDAALQEAVVTARARLLLPLDDVERRAPGRLVALAAWGFPQEVVALGGRPGLGPFPPAAAAWTDLGPPDDPTTLLQVRALLAADERHAIAVLPVYPPEWWGQPFEVHDLPTAAGLLSYAVRWHGDRPALLWDVRPAPVPPAAIGTGADPALAPPAAVPTAPPDDLRVSAPGLDPAWSARGPSGEALLGPVPRPSDRGA
jgi:hypothetical protein